jgi:hypothetical protein
MIETQVKKQSSPLLDHKSIINTLGRALNVTGRAILNFNCTSHLAFFTHHLLDIMIAYNRDKPASSIPLGNDQLSVCQLFIYLYS